MPGQTIQIDPEIEQRLKEFDEKLRYLLGKYKIGLTAVAYIRPDGRIGADVKLVDVSKVDFTKKADPPSDIVKEA